MTGAIRAGRNHPTRSAFSGGHQKRQLFFQPLLLLPLLLLLLYLAGRPAHRKNGLEAAGLKLCFGRSANLDTIDFVLDLPAASGAEFLRQNLAR